MTSFRVGRKVPRNVYRGDEPLFTAATPELATELVTLLNGGTELARIRAWAKRQGDKMDAEPNPRPPDGDDWNKLHAQVMP